MDTAEIVGDILVHYGKKGMRWGVRSRSVSATPVRTKVKPRKHMKTKVATRGGRGHPAHAEAVSVREKQQILKKSGVNALSNRDLQELQTRLNLEQNVSRLAQTKVNKAGKKWIEDQIKNTGKKVVKKGATAAAVAA